MNTTTKRLLTVDETAAYLGLAKLTVYDWVSQRTIEYVKIGRLVKFDQRVLDNGSINTQLNHDARRIASNHDKQPEGEAHIIWD